MATAVHTALVHQKLMRSCYYGALAHVTESARRASDGRRLRMAALRGGERFAELRRQAAEGVAGDDPEADRFQGAPAFDARARTRYTDIRVI
jgi:hypothetical protein